MSNAVRHLLIQRANATQQMSHCVRHDEKI